MSGMAEMRQLLRLREMRLSVAESALAAARAALAAAEAETRACEAALKALVERVDGARSALADDPALAEPRLAWLAGLGADRDAAERARVEAQAAAEIAAGRAAAAAASLVKAQAARDVMQGQAAALRRAIARAAEERAAAEMDGARRRA